jgi:streptogrisin C
MSPSNPLPREILDLNPGDDDIEGLQLDITEADEEIGQLEHTRGGRKIYNSATGSHCTTAFSVRQKSTGITGILSAGHCGADMNRYDAEDSGIHNSPESDYALIHEETYTGTYGDYAWYTTNHFELPYYWASPYSLRSVTGWDYYPSINEQVCNYSRVQGVRTCTKVYANYVTVDFVDYPPFNNHVAVLSHVTVGGDSGGPWSWNTDAYGVHSGFTTLDGVKRSVYSEMYYLQYAFGGDIELLCDGTCAVKFGSQ